MDWKINLSITVALQTLCILQLEIHEQQLAKGAVPWLGENWASSAWGGLGAPGPPSTAGWDLWHNRAGAFLEAGNGIICRFSPSWICQKFRSATLFFEVVYPSIQLTCWGGLVSNKWSCSALAGAVLTDSDATSPARVNISTSTHENTSNLSVTNPSWPLYWLPGKETLPSATPNPLSSSYMEGC